MRDWDRPDNIKPYIATLNRIRRDNPALQQTANLRFIGAEDSGVIGFVKEAPDRDNMVVAAIALSRDPHEFWLALGDATIGSGDARRPAAAVEDIVTGERHPLEWGGVRLRIDPERDPALLLRCVG